MTDGIKLLTCLIICSLTTLGIASTKDKTANQTAANSVELPLPITRLSLANGEWPPFLSEYLPHYGLGSDIVSRAFKHQGISIDYVFYPWKRAYKEAQKGSQAGTLVWSKRPDREKAFYYSDPVLTLTPVLFHLKSHPLPDFKQLSDLQGLRVGIPLGSSAPTFEKARDLGYVQLLQSGDVYTNFLLLLKKRIDILPIIKSVGEYQLRTKLKPEEAQQIGFTLTPFPPQTYHLLINKKIPQAKLIIDRFNKGLQELKASGELDQMYANFRVGLYDK